MISTNTKQKGFSSNDNEIENPEDLLFEYVVQDLIVVNHWQTRY